MFSWLEISTATAERGWGFGFFYIISFLSLKVALFSLLLRLKYIFAK
jgi:hypothetical protein